MELRQYDPAIARWIGIDPITHHSMSTYTAFDNNPVYWSDLSGANSVDQDDFYGGGNVSSLIVYGGLGGESFSFSISGSGKNKNSKKKNQDCKTCPDWAAYFGAKAKEIQSRIDNLNSVGNSNSSNKGLSSSDNLLVNSGVNGFGNAISGGAIVFAKGDAVLLNSIGNNFKVYRALENSIGYTKALRELGNVAGGLTIGFDYMRWKLMTPELRRKRASESLNRIRSSHSSPVCFVKGTRILMADLSERNIEDVKIGDLVVSANEDDFSIEIDTVRMVTHFKNKKIIKMRLENQIEIEFTENHPFWVSGKGWSVYNVESAKKNNVHLPLKTLNIGDYVYVYKKGQLEGVRVLELYDTNKFQDVYNLDDIEKNSTFFANKIFVHNRSLK